MKITNDFIELIADLEQAIKKEKHIDNQDSLKRILANVQLWSARFDAFITATGTKKEAKK